MPIKKRIIKKKRINEAKEALVRASGGEELEIAVKILGELRQRNKRKKIQNDKQKVQMRSRKSNPNNQKLKTQNNYGTYEF